MADTSPRLIAVHITADIQPFGGAGGDGPDAVTISTTYTLLDPSEAASFAEQNGGRADAGVVSTTEETEATPTTNGFALSLTIPPAGELVKGADFTATVLLPPTTLLPDGTALLPQLVSYTTEPAPQVFDGLALPTIGGRIGVVWHGTQDPTVDLEYWYRKVRQGG